MGRSKVFFLYHGTEFSISELQELTGLSASVIYWNIKQAEKYDITLERQINGVRKKAVNILDISERRTCICGTSFMTTALTKNRRRCTSCRNFATKRERFSLDRFL